MKRRGAGFTLVELLVVVLIIGVLVAIAIPRYTKTFESSKADDSQATVQMIAMANRMYDLNYGVYTSGIIPTNDSCLTATCPATPSTDPCNLMACGYMAKQSFANKPYSFRAIGNAADSCGLTGPAGTNYVACTKRASGAASPFVNWGYTVDRNGVMSAWPTTDGPPPPSS